MNVLIVKMSSMGDVIHCLPAVTDLATHVPGVKIDWLVEEGFADIPKLHPNVTSILPIAIRRWRKGWLGCRGEVVDFVKALRGKHYDVVVDAQGLIKSAVVAKLAHGKVIGLDRDSAREPLASRAYNQAINVPRNLHAVERVRSLFAQYFGYKISADIDYGIRSVTALQSKTVCLFHGTTWASKHWPDEYWVELARRITVAGYGVTVPYHGEHEKRRAEMIAAKVPGVDLIPPCTLMELAVKLSQVSGAVSVDTGLGHLAVALNLPLVGLYGPTEPGLTGIKGPRQISLSDTSLSCAPCLKADCQYKRREQSSNIHPPCFESLNPETVFDRLMVQIEK